MCITYQNDFPPLYISLSWYLPSISIWFSVNTIKYLQPKVQKIDIPFKELCHQPRLQSIVATPARLLLSPHFYYFIIWKQVYEWLVELNLSVVTLTKIKSKLKTFFSVPCLYPTVDNGFFKILDFTKPFYNRIFFEDTLLEFHCNPGYTLENSLFPTLNRSVCQLNGTWFPPVPRCILKGNVSYIH